MAELSKLLGAHIMSPRGQMPDIGLQDLMFALLGFGLTILPSMPSFTLLEWECLFCVIYHGSNFCLDFAEAHRRVFLEHVAILDLNF
jgi:hypothetical protein